MPLGVFLVLLLFFRENKADDSHEMPSLFIPRHTIVAGYYGFTLVSRLSSVRFSFPDDNLSKHQWIFTKLDMCIDIVEIWLNFTELSAQDMPIFSFPDDNLIK